MLSEKIVTTEGAARLTASALCAVIWKLGKRGENCSVAIDGSVFELHSSFANRLEKNLALLKCNCKLSLTKDGSGKGAALIAAAASC